MPLSIEQFSNFALCVLVGGAGGANTPMNPGDTQLTVNSGAGNALFPPTSGGSFRVLAGTWSGPHELMLCTARTGDLFTVTRAQEGTTAQTWQPGTIIQQVATAGSLSNLWNGLNSGREFHVEDYGAVGDGVTDNTTAIATAMSAANAAGGGTVVFGRGTFITGPQTLYSYVNLRGQGKAITVVQLKNGANADLLGAFQSNINLTGVAPNGPSWNGQAVLSFIISDMTLDGNYANQTAGPCYPLRFYGLGYQLRNLEIRNGYSGGWQADYYGPFPSSVNGPAARTNPWLDSCKLMNVNVHHSRGTTTAMGIEVGGPTDSQWTNVLSYNNNGHSFHQARNCAGLVATGCHMWQPGLADANSCCWLVESSLFATDCEAEGDPHANLVLLSTEVIWKAGAVYAGNSTGLGIQIGQQAGGTPYTNSFYQSGGIATAMQPFFYIIDTLIMFITHASGHIWFANDGGGTIQAFITAAASNNVIYSGTPGVLTILQLNNRQFSDARQQIIRSAGQISLGQSGAVDPGSGGTINTAGVTVALVQPAAAETGVILQPGTDRGQLLYVINLSAAANTISFATQATSHVADTTAAIAGLTTACYIWESGFNLWYRVK